MIFITVRNRRQIRHLKQLRRVRWYCILIYLQCGLSKTLRQSCKPLYALTALSHLALYNLNVRNDIYAISYIQILEYQDSKAHGANMGPTWALSAPDGPHAGPMNLAFRVLNLLSLRNLQRLKACSPGHHIFKINIVRVFSQHAATKHKIRPKNNIQNRIY